jgi:hypothetical protein
VSDIAILQHSSARVKMSVVMPAGKWLLLVFGLVYMLQQRCVAGPWPPSPKYIYCTPQEPTTQLPNPFPNPFPRLASFPQHPTSLFRLGEINLTRVTTPTEFRVHDLKAANATGVAQPWPPPCEVLPVCRGMCSFH